MRVIAQYYANYACTTIRHIVHIGEMRLIFTILFALVGASLAAKTLRLVLLNEIHNS